MKQRVLHITSLLLLMAAAFQCLVSCVYEDFEDRDVDSKAVLIISAASLDSRSVSELDEKLNSLRVIVLHENGSLEHNVFFADLGGVENYELKQPLLVKGMETKKIYLVANEQSIPGLNLDNLGANPAETLEAITFNAVPSDPSGNPVFEHGIPMSACYEVVIQGETRIEKEFFLVKAMTKFTFTFQNIRSDKVTLKEMEVSAFADRSYLIPQFTDANSEKVSSERFFVDEVGDYSSGSELFWIDWLKDAVVKSQSGQFTPDQIGWIKNYNLPADAVYNNPNTGITLNFPDGGQVVESVSTWTYPQAFYRCESAYIPPGGEAQEYAISHLKVKADRDVSEMEWNNQPVLKLDQVRYLFRHTHVEVNVVLGQKEVLIFARIHPWIVIKPTSPLPLEPDN